MNQIEVEQYAAQIEKLTAELETERIISASRLSTRSIDVGVIDALTARLSTLEAQAVELQKCRHGHDWSNQFGDDWTPDDNVPCDCGAKSWGQRSTVARLAAQLQIRTDERDAVIADARKFMAKVATLEATCQQQAQEIERLKGGR